MTIATSVVGEIDIERKYGVSLLRTAIAIAGFKNVTVPVNAMYATKRIMKFLIDNGHHYLFTLKKWHLAPFSELTLWYNETG